MNILILSTIIIYHEYCVAINIVTQNETDSDRYVKHENGTRSTVYSNGELFDFTSWNNNDLEERLSRDTSRQKVHQINISEIKERNLKYNRSDILHRVKRATTVSWNFTRFPDGTVTDVFVENPHGESYKFRMNGEIPQNVDLVQWVKHNSHRYVKQPLGYTGNLGNYPRRNQGWIEPFPTVPQVNTGTTNNDYKLFVIGEDGIKQIILNKPQSTRLWPTSTQPVVYETSWISQPQHPTNDPGHSEPVNVLHHYHPPSMTEHNEPINLHHQYNAPSMTDAPSPLTEATGVETYTRRTTQPPTTTTTRRIPTTQPPTTTTRKISYTTPKVSSGHVFDTTTVVGGKPDVFPQHCGHRRKENGDKILGGRPSPVENNPWQVGLYFDEKEFKCGGSIITHRHVLTAAHCLYDRWEQRWLTKYDVIVRVGDFDRDVIEEYEASYAVETIYRHTKFAPYENNRNDIALLMLEQILTFSTAVFPICIPPLRIDYITGTECIISGWGATETNAEASRYLREVNIKLIDDTVCRSSYSSQNISSGMFCAGDTTNGGLDTCQGDSGGPLVSKYRGRYFLFGITSWGQGCGSKEHPGVYTKVSKYRPWIINKIKLSELQYKSQLLENIDEDVV